MAAEKQLNKISIITYCVDDLETVQAAWETHLEYRLVERGALPDSLCAAWKAPAEAGRPYCLLQPASGAQIFMRFIETGPREGYLPNLSWGWNVTEILTEDPDELAKRLAGSSFDIIYGPADLVPTDKAPRVVQTQGPAGELVYFTRILPGGSRYGLEGAACFVDRPFNIAMGGPSIDDLVHFYSNVMGLQVDDPVAFRGTLAARASEASPDAAFLISVARVENQRSILELDDFPSQFNARPRAFGCIPGGLSMVSFLVDDLEQVPMALVADPQSISCAPYGGRRVVVITGPAGEWLELIEAT